MRHPDLVLCACVPTVVTVAMAAFGLGAFDYHLALAVAAPTAWAVANEVAAVAARRALPVWWRLALALLGPLAVAAIAAPWAPSCNVVDSLAWWAIGPFGAAAWGAGAGAVIAIALPARWVTRGGVVALATLLVFLASCAPGAWWFLAHPQVFGYGPPIGRIAGALFEDAVAVGWPDAAYRLLDVGLAAPVLGLLWAVRGAGLPWRATSLRLLARTGAPIWPAVAVAVLSVAVGQSRARDERWRVDDADMAMALTETLVVTGDRGQTLAKLHTAGTPRLRYANKLVAADVAFRYKQLRQWFGHDIDDLQLFVWPDAATKRRWTGAHRVEMAKPWLRQIHVVLPDYGASILAHEMAHVFAAGWTPGPLGVPLRHGLIPDAMAIEGVAVAAEWPLRGGLDPHQWARAARQLGKAPPLEAMLSPAGFFRQNTELSYTLAGSLFRYIGAAYGHTVLARAYRDGDVAAATGLDRMELLGNWAAYVDDAKRNPLTDADVERARARFAPPGVFDRPCALAVGRCHDRAAALHAGGNDGQAAALLAGLAAQLSAVAPVELATTVSVRVAEAAAGHPRAAAVALAQWAAALPASGPHQLNQLQRATLTALLGDLWWHAGDLHQASTQWLQALKAPFDEATLRTLQVKLALAAVPEARDTMAHVLTAGGTVGDTAAILAELHRQLPEHPLATYLWARWQLRETGDAPALPLLRIAEAQLAALPQVAREARRTIALALARRHDCAGLDALPLADQPVGFVAEMRERCATRD